jgi:hypothetical protein
MWASIAPGAAEHAGFGAERQRLDHIEPAAHATVHEDFEPVTDGIGDAGQGGDAGGDAVQLPAAVVGDDDAVDTSSHGLARILDVEDALQHDPARPVLAHPGQVLPGDARVELAVHPGLELGQAACVGYRCGQVAKHQGLALDRDVEQPLWMREQVPGLAQLAGQREAAGHAVAHVAVARAHHGEVDGQHQYLAAGGPRPRHQVFGIAAVAHDVELVPEGGGGRGAHFLDRADRHRRFAEGHAGGFGRACRLHLRAAGHGAGQAERGEHHGQGQVLPQHAGGQLDLRNVAQYALAQLQTAEALAVGGGGGFLVGGAVEVVEQVARQATACEFAVVVRRGGGEAEAACFIVHGSHSLKMVLPILGQP